MFARKGTNARENKHLVSTNGKAQSIPLVKIEDLLHFGVAIYDKNHLYMKKESEDKKMANYNFTFDDVVRYAEGLGWEHREGPSKAKDYTMTFWQTPYGETIMSLYEGERRTLRGKTKPEVCWICIHGDGSVSSVPSRYFQRYYTEKRGFYFTQSGKQRLADYFTRQEEDMLCLD